MTAMDRFMDIVEEVGRAIDALTPEEAMEEVRAFTEREQEDEDKPWAKPI